MISISGRYNPGERGLRAAQKVPFMLIAGDDDIAQEAVSFRYRDGTQRNGLPLAEAIEEIVEAVASHAQI